MALNELERARCEKALSRFMERRRPPPRIRDEIDLSYRIAGPSVEILEIHPDWQDRRRKTERPVAKATFVRTSNSWKVFWMRRDSKWHGYQPQREVRLFEVFLEIVDRDEFGCFFG